MKTFRIVNGFEKMTDGDLLVKGRFIHQNMGGNDHFPTPVPTLTELNTTLNSYEAALPLAESGDRQQIAVKNQIRDVLINQLHLLGNYVLFASAGNEVAATSSGFSINKVPAPVPPMTSPQGLVLKNGVNRGELYLRFKKVQGARSYVYEITPAPVTANSQWESSMNTICRKQFSGLESGKEYACRVAAVGVKEQVVYSDVVAKVAL